jgi:hypothetical protein
MEVIAVFHPIHAKVKEIKELAMTTGNGIASVDGVQPAVMLDEWVALMKPCWRPADPVMFPRSRVKKKLILSSNNFISHLGIDVGGSTRGGSSFGQAFLAARHF